MIITLLNSLLIVVFIQQNCIILNVYNGDILNIGPNLEYMLWYFIFLIPLLIISLYKLTLFYIKFYLFEIIICIKGILYNIYWHYAWKLEDEDKRHRTEFYDTQTLLCSMIFVLLVQKLDTLIKVNNKISNKICDYEIEPVQTINYISTI